MYSVSIPLQAVNAPLVRSSRLFALALGEVLRGKPAAMYRILIVAFAFAACSRPVARPMRLEPFATIGAGLGGEFAGGDAGPPCAVAAGGRAVFLGWPAARAGHGIVACDPGGRPLRGAFRLVWSPVACATG